MSFNVSFDDFKTPHLKLGRPNPFDKLCTGGKFGDVCDVVKKSRKVTLRFDGGSRGNPGVAGSGSVLLDDDGSVIWSSGHFLGRHSTNNEAEYDGLIQGLKYIEGCIGGAVSPLKGVSQLYIEGDSQLVIKQMNETYKTHSNHLQKLNKIANDLLKSIKTKSPNMKVSFKHIYRDKNSIADGLANRAMDEGR